MCKQNQTKADTLEQLKDTLDCALVLPIVKFSYLKWKEHRIEVLDHIKTTFKNSKLLIVRSSATNEDSDLSSNAGKYKSILNVKHNMLEESIVEVITSYEKPLLTDQVFVQPMLTDTIMSGVLFTTDPKTKAPYYVINYNEDGATDTITSGKKYNIHTQIISKSLTSVKNKYFNKLINLSRELEKILQNNALDIEFAFDKKNILYLFQVRPIVSTSKVPNKITTHKEYLSIIENKITQHSQKHPYLHGDKTIFGVMPDWNPAEIIGTKPNPLSLSLYKELITDSSWAYQRNNYGYKNLRSFPLLIDFLGLPYIDVRVSFNSFLPKNLEENLSEKLVNYYINCLERSPSLHDKVEFKIIYSCYSFDLNERISTLKKHNFSDSECDAIKESLLKLTNVIINGKQGIWTQDIEKISELKKRHEQIYFNSNFDDISKIYWLVEYCKRYGTLPFAGLARAAFIAVQILDSMVAVGALSHSQKLNFLNSINSISSQITNDSHRVDKQHFLQKYGHLRPGTYNILSPRYDEKPDIYFDWNTKNTINKKLITESFNLTVSQMQNIAKMLEKHGIENDVVGLFTFLKSAIEGREYAKFVFTKSLSDILLLIKNLGQKNNFSPEDMSHIDIQSILQLYSSSNNLSNYLDIKISLGKEKYNITKQITLPSLISNSQDIYNFSLLDSEPNFIGNKSTTAKVLESLTDKKQIKGSIIFIPQADPGFDWLFSKSIAGLVTAYGGTNSHMAIRANELGIPAIIGVGEKLYNHLVKAKKLHIDCTNNYVEVIEF